MAKGANDRGIAAECHRRAELVEALVGGGEFRLERPVAAGLHEYVSHPLIGGAGNVLDAAVIMAVLPLIATASWPK